MKIIQYIFVGVFLGMYIVYYYTVKKFVLFSIQGYFMYISSSKGKPGDEAQLSNKTEVNIDKGSITFRYYLYGDTFQILNVFFGAGVKGRLAWSKSGDEKESDWHFTCLTINEPIK